MRRGIERKCADIQLLVVGNKDIICSKNIPIDILSLHFEKKTIEQLQNIEENIYSLATAICKEPKESTYHAS